MNILIPLAEGFEEIEAVTSIDVLRRAGLNVVTVGMPGTHVIGSRGLQVIADRKMEDVNPDEFDALILVGGDPGYRNLGKSQTILDTIRKFDSEKKLIGAICAAPSILSKAGILEERRATIYPGMERDIPRPRDRRLIADDNVITSQAPGTAMEFALKIVETMMGEEKAKKLREEMIC